MAGPEPGGGLCWSFELDLAGVLAAIDAAGDEDPGDQEASLAAERVAAGSAGVRSRDLTGVIAGQLPAGPGLAAWLANADPGVLSDWDLPGIAAAYRRVASWAAAGELAAVAAIASRTAVRDPRADVDDQGRPDRVTAGAACEVSLALTMSQAGASWWTRLGVELGWRLRDTGAALAAGTIDLARARLIAEAAGPLTDEDAQAVEALVLPGAGGQTTGQLRAALRRAVLRVDPEGAEERRQNAERQATVSLYPDEVGTAALVASHLPGVQAAAMMARLTAIAAGMKASGAGGGIGLLRAVALAGLVLGTLPLTPAPPGSPPDSPGPGPGDDPGAGGPGPGSGPGASGGPGGGRGARRRPPDLAGDGPRRGRRPGGGSRPAPKAGPDRPPPDPRPRPADWPTDPAPPGAGPPGPSRPSPPGSGPDRAGSGPSSGSGLSGSGSPGSGPPDSGPPASGPPDSGPADTGPPDGGPPGGDPAGETDEAPPLTDADVPDHDDGGACARVPGPGDGWDEPDDDYEGGVLPAWPPLPGTLAEIPPFLGGPRAATPAPPGPALPPPPWATRTAEPPAGRAGCWT